MSERKHSRSNQIGSYRLGRTLGIGTFSKVKLGVHEVTGKRVAIKILNRRKLRSMEMEHKVEREIHILAKLNHPHVIRLYEVLNTPTDIFVIMEYVPRGELFEYIVSNGRLSENQARKFLQQIIAGVEYCHAKRVVHRDLKPENLLLDDSYNLRIADFGLSNTRRDGFFLRTSCGSPNYAAPEVIGDLLYAGPEVDVWSCGVILYALLVGSLPFDDDNIPDLFRKIKNAEYTKPSWLPEGASRLISRMLVVDPMQRITIPEVRSDPWFLTDIPRYLTVDPVKNIEFTEKKVSSRIVAKCAEHGFTEEETHRALKLGYRLLTDRRFADRRKYARLREAAVCYHLHFDQQYRLRLAQDIERALHRQAVTNMDALDIRTPDEQRKTHAQELQRLRLDKMKHGAASQQRTFEDEQYSVKWRVGLWTRTEAEEFMCHVLESLKALDMEWYMETPYCVVARSVVPKGVRKKSKPEKKEHPENDSDSIGMTDLLSESEDDTDDPSAYSADPSAKEMEEKPPLGPAPEMSESSSEEDDLLGGDEEQKGGDGAAKRFRTKRSRAAPGFEMVKVKLQLYKSRPTQSLSHHSRIAQATTNIPHHHHVGSHMHHRHGQMPDSVQKKSDEVFAVQYRSYLLDIQKISGQTFPFLDFCARLMSQMQYLPQNLYA